MLNQSTLRLVVLGMSENFYSVVQLNMSFVEGGGAFPSDQSAERQKNWTCRSSLPTPMGFLSKNTEWPIRREQEESRGGKARGGTHDLNY